MILCGVQGHEIIERLICLTKAGTLASVLWGLLKVLWSQVDQCEIATTGLPSNQKLSCSMALHEQCLTENRELEPHFVPTTHSPIK